MWYICTREYYSAIKRNAFESVLMRWMSLEPIIQSEISRKEKNKCCILMLYMESRKIVLINLLEVGNGTPLLQVVTEPQFEFPESYSKFPLAI